MIWRYYWARSNKNQTGSPTAISADNFKLSEDIDNELKHIKNDLHEIKRHTGGDAANYEKELGVFTHQQQF